MLEAALDYRDRGWSVLPIKPRTKQPNTELLPRGSNGRRSWKSFQESRPSVAVIREWFEKDPDTGIGIVCGEVSDDLVVIDFDGIRPPVDAFPETALAETPGDGLHVYARSRGQLKTRVFSHGEIRGKGSYVVAPPSVHPSGRRYRWLKAPDEARLAPLEAVPSRLIDFAHAHVVSLHQPLTPTSAVPRDPYEIPRDDLQLSGSLPGERDSGAGLDIASLAKSEGAVAQVAARLGISFRGAFLCILPDHEERSPSASLYRDPETDLFLYRDWHERNGHSWYTLAELRASLGYRRAVKLRASEQARWYARLFYEAGLIKPVSIQVPTDGLDAVEKTVADGFALLLALNWIKKPGEPAAFTRRFAAAWCGTSEREAARALQGLRRRDVIRVVGEHERRGGGRFPLYLPGTGLARNRGAA